MAQVLLGLAARDFELEQFQSGGKLVI